MSRGRNAPRVARALLVALAALVVTGCGGTRRRSRAGTVAEVIETARQNGAQRCAPVELAMAESHHDFAVTELDEGDYFRAREELAVAEKNANEAVRRSPRERCVDAPPPVVGDRDGDGILDDVDACPDQAEDKDGFEDSDGCPDNDNDHDGLADKVDDCPDQAEDKDGFEDTDGCPDDDNDKDGLADRIDQCPEIPEDKDGFQDDDGCPDCDDDGDGVPECPEPIDKCPGVAAKTADGCPQYKNVVITDKKIEIKQTVYFDTGKATIKRVSFSLLDEVAQALRDNPTIKVRVEGHTDSQGKDAYNLKLSKARAASVRQYLMGAGIDEARMVSEGYGETQPIADNRTAAGRAQNRRVEFVITSR